MDDLVKTCLVVRNGKDIINYSDVIMSAISSQITVVYSTFSSDANHRNQQNSSLLPFASGIHRWPVNSLVNSAHKGPVTQKMFPFDDAIMFSLVHQCIPFTETDIRWTNRWYFTSRTNHIVICNDHQFCYNCNCLDEDEVFKISSGKDHHDVIK